MIWIFLGMATNCFILKVFLRTFPSMVLTPDLSRLCAACLLLSCLHLCSDNILAIVFVQATLINRIINQEEETF